MLPVERIEIRDFRCFARFSAEGFARVNVLVGANNSGKTALLEAIEAVTSEQSPFVLYRASLDRGESRVGRASRVEDAVELDVRRWFRGHLLEEGTRFEIRTAGQRERSLSRSIVRVTPELPTPPFVPGGLMLTLERGSSSTTVRPLPLTPDGFLGAGSPSTFFYHGRTLRPPVAFLTTRRLFAGELLPLWSSIVLTPAEEMTTAALRLIEPMVDRIALSGGTDPALAQILLRGEDRPVPLGTLGEGVSRLLALAIHLAAARGGFLLVDEIENGIHWSVMPKLWRFIAETARELDVQVFTTTHSKDAVEAIAELYRNAPLLAQDIALHRLEAGRPASVRFDAGQVAEYVQMELETR